MSGCWETYGKMNYLEHELSSYRDPNTQFHQNFTFFRPISRQPNRNLIKMRNRRNLKPEYIDPTDLSLQNRNPRPPSSMYYEFTANATKKEKRSQPFGQKRN